MLLLPHVKPLCPPQTPVSPQVFLSDFLPWVFSKILRTRSAVLKSRGVIPGGNHKPKRGESRNKGHLQWSRGTLLRSFLHSSTEYSTQDCVPAFAAINSSVMYTFLVFLLSELAFLLFRLTLSIPLWLPGITSKINLLNPSPYFPRLVSRGNWHEDSQCHSPSFLLYFIWPSIIKFLWFYHGFQISLLSPSPLPSPWIILQSSH